MGRVKKGSSATKQRAGEQSWQEFIADRIRSKKVVPIIISNRLAADYVMGGYEALIDAYVEYAQEDKDFLLERRNFSQMLQFRRVADPSMRRDKLVIKTDYINFIKNRLYDLAEAEGADPDVLEDVEDKWDETPLFDFATALNYPRFGGKKDPYLSLEA